MWNRRTDPYLLLVLIKKIIKFEPGVKTCINCSRMNSSIIWYPLLYRNTPIFSKTDIENWVNMCHRRGCSFKQVFRIITRQQKQNVTDDRTDGRTEWSLCGASLRWYHKNYNLNSPNWEVINRILNITACSPVIRRAKIFVRWLLRIIICATGYKPAI